MAFFIRMASGLFYRAGGNVAILVGLVLLPIVIFAGIATDKAGEAQKPAAIAASATAR